MPKDIAMPGDYASNAGAVRTNRTGASIAIGGVAIVDATQAEAESTSVALGQQNLTAVTSTNLKAGKVVVNVTGAAVADNADGRFCESNDGAIVQALVNSTTDIAKGDWLKPVNGQAYLVKGTNGTDRTVARALEARTSDDTGLIYVELFSNGCFQTA
jgi:hypothetical protein